MPVVPIYYLPIAFSLGLFSPLFPPGILRASTGLLIDGYMLYSTRTALSNSTESVPHVVDYAVHGILVFFMLRWIDYFVLHTPERDFYRVRRLKKENKTGTESVEIVEIREAVPKTLLGKFEWALDLTLSVRGEGWNFRIRNLPDGPSDKCSRIQFITSQTLLILICQVAIEFFHILIQTTTYTDPPTSQKLSKSFPQDSLVTQVLVSVSVVASSYFNFTTIHSISAIFFTAIGYTEPSSWRPMFGNPLFNTNVRDYWGRGWHQIMRRNILEPGRWLSRKLGLNRGSFSDRYLQMYLGFLISAFAHSRPVSKSGVTTYHWAEYAFMLAQATFITFEDMIRTLYYNLGGRSNFVTLVLGISTTLLWMCLTLPICAYGTATDGLLSTQPDPTSSILRSFPCYDCESHQGEFPWQMITIRALQCFGLVCALQRLRIWIVR